MEFGCVFFLSYSSSLALMAANTGWLFLQLKGFL
jgi:hypothetical protein